MYAALANASMPLRFYAGDACHESGYGEGECYLASETIDTGASGDGTFSVTFSQDVEVGTAVTATATDPSGHTSEFSA